MDISELRVERSWGKGWGTGEGVGVGVGVGGVFQSSRQHHASRHGLEAVNV